MIGYKFDSLSGDTKSTNVSLLRYPDNKQDYTGLKWNDGSKPAKSYRQPGIRAKLGTSASMWKLTVISFFRINPTLHHVKLPDLTCVSRWREGVGGWAVNRQTREGNTSCFHDLGSNCSCFLFVYCLTVKGGVTMESCRPCPLTSHVTWLENEAREGGDC